MSNKLNKRISSLYKDIERVAAEPTFDFEVVNRELESLRRRLARLEEQIQDADEPVAADEAAVAKKPVEKASPEPTRPSAPTVYEAEQIGYAYRPEEANAARISGQPAQIENAIRAPLLEAGQPIGTVMVEFPPERAWSPEETDLTEAIARQVSLRVQNLRLLDTAERARADAQAATRRFMHESWDSFLDAIHQSERIGFMYDREAVAPWQESSPADVDLQEDVSVLDEQIGSLFLKADPARPLNEGDKEFVQAVARLLGRQVENLRLLADASRARAEAEDATRRLTHEGWQGFTSQQGKAAQGFVYDSNLVRPLEESVPPEAWTLELPLTIRGETIGKLAVADKKDVSAEDAVLANAIADRVSIHLETLRLSEQNEKRAYNLATVATVSTTVSTVLDPDELLQSVVDLTKTRFNIYHAHIYLADEAWNTLLLSAGAGEVGRQMVANGHAIPMDAEKSLVARASRERKAVIANDVYSIPDFLPNPLLPDTRSEMAVPMIAGDKVLGVFDVQSELTAYFTDEDANIYTTLAAQVSVALQNARLYVAQTATVAQLRELDRLKSSFLANMSHELRTPLNSILGFSDVILEELDGPLTPNMNNDVRLIQKNGQHLLHLINDVLDMAKIEAGRMNLAIEKFNLHDIIEDVISITSTLATAKSLALFIEDDSERAAEIIADRTRIRQVLINLVNNAIKFTEKGAVSIRVVGQGKTVLICVKDTGIGINPEQLEVVFQEFTQVDTSTTRKAGGTGLGLPISRRLVEMHGGRVWAESTGVSGEGSTFYILLPVEAVIKESDQDTVK